MNRGKRRGKRLYNLSLDQRSGPIVIQLETWWNQSTEFWAIVRCPDGFKRSRSCTRPIPLDECFGRASVVVGMLSPPLCCCCHRPSVTITIASPLSPCQIRIAPSLIISKVFACRSSSLRVMIDGCEHIVSLET